MTGATGPRRLADGRLLVLLRGVGPDGEIAEGLVPIGPDHPDYPIWDDWLPRQDET